MNEALFTSKTDLWETPQDLFDKLDAEFGFELDVCALPENAKLERQEIKRLRPEHNIAHKDGYPR